MLELNNVEVTYDRNIQVLRGMSMRVQQGKIVTLLGSNGAGKSTTLKAISGLLLAENGRVTDGTITYDGQSIQGVMPDVLVKRGLFHVLEGRHVFEHLNVEENLLAGAYTSSERNAIKQRLDKVYEYFPKLRPLKRRTSGFLSGGEQQMLAIGRALMANPKCILLDEPSLGLAPMLVKEIFNIIKDINTHEKTTFLIVEQNARIALSIADYGYIMENGKVVMEGEVGKLLTNEDVKEFYLGMSQDSNEQRYRDIKHYKRRKRWLG